MTYDNDARMIAKQAEIISKLNEQVRKLNESNLKLQGVVDNSVFYLEMQKAILENENLKEEWNRFVMLLKLTVPELENRMKEIKKKIDYGTTTWV